MNSRIFVFAAILLGIAPVATASASVPEFSGYLVVGKQRLFVLTTLPSQESSGWLAIGGTFSGLTIEAFDPKDEILFCRSGSQVVKLPLKSSRVAAIAIKTRPQTRSSQVEGGVELKLSLSAEGQLSLNGHTLPGETLDALFAVMARENDALRLMIEKQLPLATSFDDTVFLKALMARMRSAGLKRGAIQMTHRADEGAKE